jgi:hypothetical protein
MPGDNTREHYHALGLEPEASLTEVKRAYRTLAKAWHPDRFSRPPPFCSNRHWKNSRPLIMRQARCVSSNAPHVWPVHRLSQNRHPAQQPRKSRHRVRRASRARYRHGLWR